MDTGRPAWVEVDLEAIRSNVRAILHLVGPRCGVMAVVKANGYGHGLVETARAALDGGADALGVACASEALALRQAGIEAAILVMGAIGPDEARELVWHGVVAGIDRMEEAGWLSRAARGLGRDARVHLKVDSGMGRRGVLPQHAVAFAQHLAATPGIRLCAAFTHFATADEPDMAFAQEQARRFYECVQAIREGAGDPVPAHAAASAALLRLPEARHDWVRPGIIMYGVLPYAGAADAICVRSALRIRARLSSVKEMQAGASVGYGRAYVMPEAGRIAIVPLGYGDGFSRHNTNNGAVLVRGRRAPIRGRICMDQFMVDVTDIPDAQPGDEVVVLGPQGDDEITAGEIAGRTGTIPYETLCALTDRLPRHYLNA